MLCLLLLQSAAARFDSCCCSYFGSVNGGGGDDGVSWHLYNQLNERVRLSLDNLIKSDEMYK